MLDIPSIFSFPLASSTLSFLPLFFVSQELFHMLQLAEPVQLLYQVAFAKMFDYKAQLKQFMFILILMAQTQACWLDIELLGWQFGQG